jgi:hypothetical protein
MTGWDVAVAAIVFLVFIYEMGALAKRTDGWQPYTYYVRRMIRSKLLWAAAFLFWLWLGFHFFIERG